MIERNERDRGDVTTLKKLRTLLGLSQEEIAKELGTKKQVWQRWEAGQREPSLKYRQVKRLLALLKKHKINWDDLPDDLTSTDWPLKPKA